jgi:hypothetical protein
MQKSRVWIVQSWRWTIVRALWLPEHTLERAMPRRPALRFSHCGLQGPDAEAPRPPRGRAGAPLTAPLPLALPSPTFLATRHDRKEPRAGPPPPTTRSSLLLLPQLESSSSGRRSPPPPLCPAAHKKRAPEAP